MVTRRSRVGERRWPMAAAVLLTGLLRIALPPQLRLNDARPVLFAVLLGLVVAPSWPTLGGSTGKRPGCVS